jgi:malonate transporter
VEKKVSSPDGSSCGPVTVLAGEYRCEEMMVASTVSLTMLASIISLVVWLYELSGLAKHISAG